MALLPLLSRVGTQIHTLNQHILLNVHRRGTDLQHQVHLPSFRCRQSYYYSCLSFTHLGTYVSPFCHLLATTIYLPSHFYPHLLFTFHLPARDFQQKTPPHRCGWQFLLLGAHLYCHLYSCAFCSTASVCPNDRNHFFMSLFIPPLVFVLSTLLQSLVFPDCTRLISTRNAFLLSMITTSS